MVITVLSLFLIVFLNYSKVVLCLLLQLVQVAKRASPGVRRKMELQRGSVVPQFGWFARAGVLTQTRLINLDIYRDRYLVHHGRVP